jgi:metal-sulfur cluster biosynthetic enzyme
MANVLYDDIAKAIRQLPKPVKELTLDVVLHPEWLSLRIYEEEIMQYDIDQRADIMQYLLLMREVVQSFGVRCEIDGGKYVPRKRKR